MIILSGIFLILAGMYILYLLSSKQIEKTRKSPLKKLAKYRELSRLLAFVLFFVAAGLFIVAYGSSIGFVSWWIFATPFTFLLILYLNDLKQKPSKKKNKLVS